jgi:hypothetical protein
MTDFFFRRLVDRDEVPVTEAESRLTREMAMNPIGHQDNPSTFLLERYSKRMCEGMVPWQLRDSRQGA